MVLMLGVNLKSYRVFVIDAWYVARCEVLIFPIGKGGHLCKICHHRVVRSLNICRVIVCVSNTWV
jgi:hypothetical protein